MADIAYKIDGKKVVGDILSEVIGSLLMGAGVYIFATGSNFATGGVSGIALMMNYLFHLPMGAVTLALNVPLIAISYRILGRAFLMRTLRTLVVQALIFDNICIKFPAYEGEPLMAALYTGALMGAGLALIYIRDSSTGGTDLIIMSLHKLKPHVSLGQLSLLTDGCVILCGVFVFGNIDAVLHGVVASAVCTIVMDKIVAGTGSGKIAMVICEDGMKVAEAIATSADRGSTIIEAMGPYTKEDKDVIVCACSKREIFKVRQSVYAVDPGALVMVLTYDETFGYGFKKPEQPEAQRLLKQKADQEAADAAEQEELAEEGQAAARQAIAAEEKIN